jgi:NADP-dependent 3-hydroxy acid dehydrogenase YdfG
MNDATHEPAGFGAGRTLLITGASSGIGAATARAAHGAGYNLVLAARSLDKLESLAGELGDERAFAVECDVTSWDDQQAAAAAARDRFGAIDAVFANAGFGARRGFLEETPEQWESMVLTNVLGVALTIRATLEDLKARQGHMLITGSIAGTRALPGSLYAATKAAVHSIAEGLRQELNGTGVRTTLIAPGMVDTPFFDKRPLDGALNDDDIARAVIYALEQPPHVDVNMVLVRPTSQPL